MSETNSSSDPLERVLLSEIRRYAEDTQEPITIVRLIQRARTLLSADHDVEALDDDIKDELKRLRGEGLIDVVQPRRLSPSEITASLTPAGQEVLAVLDTQPKINPEAARRARLERQVGELEDELRTLRVEVGNANARAVAAEEAARNLKTGGVPAPLVIGAVVLSVLALVLTLRLMFADPKPVGPFAPTSTLAPPPLPPPQVGQPTPDSIDVPVQAPGPSPFVPVDE